MTTNTPELRAAFESLVQITRQLSDTLENVIYHLEQNDTMAPSTEDLKPIVSPLLLKFYSDFKKAHLNPLDEKMDRLEKMARTIEENQAELAALKAEIANLKRPSVSAAAQPFTTFTPPSVRPASSSVPPQDQPPAPTVTHPIISPTNTIPAEKTVPDASTPLTVPEQLEAFTTEFNEDDASDYQFFAPHTDQISRWAKNNFNDNSQELILVEAEPGSDFQGKKLPLLSVDPNNRVSCYAISISKILLENDQLNSGLLEQFGFTLAFDITNPEKLNNQQNCNGKLLRPALFKKDSSVNPPTYKLYKKGTLELI